MEAYHVELSRKKNHKNSKENGHKKKKQKLQEFRLEEEEKLNESDSEGEEDLHKFQYIQSSSDICKKRKTKKKNRIGEVLPSEEESFEGIKCKYIHKNDSNKKCILSEVSSIEIQSDSNHKKEKQKLHKCRLEQEVEPNVKKSKNKEKLKCEGDESNHKKKKQKVHEYRLEQDVEQNVRIKNKEKLKCEGDESNHKKKKQKVHEYRLEQDVEQNVRIKNKEKLKCEGDESNHKKKKEKVHEYRLEQDVEQNVRIKNREKLKFEGDESNHKKKKQKVHEYRLEQDVEQNVRIKNKEKLKCEGDEDLLKLKCIQPPSTISKKQKIKKKNKTDKVLQCEEESFKKIKCMHKKKDSSNHMLFSSELDGIEIHRESDYSTCLSGESNNESEHFIHTDLSSMVNQEGIKKHSQKDCKLVSCISSPVKEAMERNEMGTPFSSLHGVVSSATMDAINSLGFKTMTEIQTQAIPPLLEGKDLRGTAKTGSGKTLAFLIPAVELLHRLKFEPCHGTGVLVLSPTRELALQSYSMTQRLLQYHHGLSCALITGGKDREEEARELSNGASLVIATPGRLLDHFQSEVFHCDRLAALVVDEADRMLGTAFEEQVMRILTMLPSQRQTMLFSATTTSRSHPLIHRALRDDFVDVDVTRAADALTCDTLQQAFAVCPTELKFLFLYKFLKKQCRQHKVIVFFSTCDAVQYYTELLNVVCVDVNGIHGKQKQGERTACFRRFNEARTGALLCTDVAARGWDIPGVDWVLQYDPPEDTSEYVHRVGRTARGTASGRALLLLREEERPYVACVQERCRATLQEMVIREDRIPAVQEKVEAVVQGNAYITQCGRLAFKSYIHSYTMHKRKDIFNIYSLDIRKLGKSFGFSTPPRVDLAIEYKKGSEKKLRRRVGEGYYQGEGPEAKRKRKEKERENESL